MTTTTNDIRRWLNEGKRKGASHVVVMCDTWDYTDYPVYVMPGQTPRDEAKKADGGMAKIMECYDLGMDLEAQLKPGVRVMNDKPRATIQEPPHAR